jgi:hypothetical protein
MWPESRRVVALRPWASQKPLEVTEGGEAVGAVGSWGAAQGRTTCHRTPPTNLDPARCRSHFSPSATTGPALPGLPYRACPTVVHRVCHATLSSSTVSRTDGQDPRSHSPS